jgi:hypothetical protein
MGCECHDPASRSIGLGGVLRSASNELVNIALDHPLRMLSLPSGEGLVTVRIDDLIGRADDHVTIGKDGQATIAKSIERSLSSAEIEHVAALVAIHNLKLHIGEQPVKRTEPTDTPSDTAETSQPLGDPPPPAPTRCTPHASISFYWWGFRIHLDHCFCKMIPVFGAVGTGVGAGVASLLAASQVAGGPYVAIAAGIIAFMAGWIAYADGACTPNSGANYNQSWTVQGWITTVC